MLRELNLNEMEMVSGGQNGPNSGLLHVNGGPGNTMYDNGNGSGYYNGSTGHILDTIDLAVQYGVYGEEVAPPSRSGHEFGDVITDCCDIPVIGTHVHVFEADSRDNDVGIFEASCRAYSDEGDDYCYFVGLLHDD